jgi:hypothetical protein
MGNVIPLTRARRASHDLTTEEGLEPTAAKAAEHELWPIEALLFVFSAARVVHAIMRHEPFDTEPTLALLCVFGLPLLAC